MSVSITTTSTDTANDTLDILGLDNIQADLKLELPQPLKTEGSEKLTIEPLKADLDFNDTTHLQIDPLKTDSRVEMDLRPVVLDLCATLNVGKLPNVCVRQPYHHHVGFTLWGVEVWGYTFRGEQETVIHEQNPAPQIAVWAGPGDWPDDRERRHPRHPDRWSHTEHPTKETGGLRVRLGP